MSFFDPALRWIAANRAVFVLSVLLFCFFISTIALAVRKNNLVDELDTCKANSDNGITPSFEYRLSTDVIPIAYDLTLRPDLEADSFEGNVKIKLKLGKNIRQFALHKGTDMTITKAEVLGATANENLNLATSYNVTLDYMILTVNGVLLATGDDKFHTISIDFASKDMSKSNLGFYSSTYMDGGKEHKMVSSKFQPTYARRAFPCFDEPGYKAKFTIRLVTPGTQYKALSNMEEDSTAAEGTKQIVTFKESVEMSTYLAVFMVSELVVANTAKLEGTNIQFTVYSADDQKADVQYSFEVGKKLAEFYIKYFGVDYPLAKLDMAGIPQYPTGATEHWGLITFRQSSFMYNPLENSARNKQRVAEVISHELVHQWFGNLVTMHWWNDIWLNEGFASYIEYKGLTEAEPTWQIMDHFTVDNLHSVLQLDALPSTRAIIKDADTPDEITALFDSIAYNKAASIIRMLDDFVGPANFQKAVTKYLTDFKYKSTVTSDFLKCFEDLPDIKVAEIMDTWTVQPGYPLLTVSKINETFVKVTQERFSINTQTKIDPLKYTIPIRYRTNSMAATDPALLKWMSKEEDSIELELGVRTWYKLNEDQVGYYRVNYEESMWTELSKVLTTWTDAGANHFSPLNRAHLLNDVFALADGEYLPYTTALDMMNYLNEERNLVPWTVAISQAKKLLALLASDSVYSDLSNHFHDLSSAAYEDVKFSGCVTETVTEEPPETVTEEPTEPPMEVCLEDEEEDHSTQLLREKLVDFACQVGHSECEAQVKIHFSNYLELNTPVSPNVRQSVYYYGLRSATATIWNFMFDRLKVETDPQEQTKLMYGLSSSPTPSLLTTYIERAWEELKAQDFFTVLQYISDNPIGQSIVWDWVQENWQGKLVERYTINERTLGRVIPNITRRFATQKRYDELIAFFAKYPEAGAGAAAREEAKETIQTNIRWMSINEPIIKAWLAKPTGS